MRCTAHLNSGLRGPFSPSLGAGALTPLALNSSSLSRTNRLKAAVLQRGAGEWWEAEEAGSQERG